MKKIETMIQRIQKKTELFHCPLLPISHYQWTSLQQPEAFGQIAYLSPGKLLVSLTCLESDPLCTMTEHNDPVYQDSALEFFIQPHGCQGYFNFECNAMGAMLAMYGRNLTDRKTWDRDQVTSLEIQACQDPGRWNIAFQVPETMLQAFEPFPSWEEEPIFSFNLYKISETPSIEHYGSYAPIHSPVPNFHRPSDFAIGTIIQGKGN